MQVTRPIIVMAMTPMSMQLNRLALLVAAAMTMSLGSAADGTSSLAIVCQRCNMMPSVTPAHRQILAHWLSNLSDAAGAFRAAPSGCDQPLAYCVAPSSLPQGLRRWCRQGLTVDLDLLPRAPIRPHLTDLPPPPWIA